MTTPTFKLSDNSYCQISDEDALKLRRFSGLSLDKLCLENPELLVFPHCLGANGDNIGENPLFSLSGEYLSVGNVVGFWGVDGVHVRIHSRFDSDERPFLFHYMLQRVSGVNLLNMDTKSDTDDIWDFLIYLFPIVLKPALAQGIFRAYRVFSYDDAHLRGQVDVSQFIRRDIPFAGHIAYVTREHTANNHVIQLARHVIEFVRRRAPFLLSIDQEMRQAVGTIVELTPNYEERTRNKIIAANLRPLRHPYYSAYSSLQKICLQILRHERISFGENDKNIHGIVFDAAWLWEEYLARVFAEDVNTAGIVHPQNKLRKSSIQFFLFGHYPLYPDFYDNNRRLVMDAKYKRLENAVEREDLFQMTTYLHVLKHNQGLFLFPSNSKTCQLQPVGVLNGFGGRMDRLSLSIPSIDSVAKFKDFALKIRENEQVFRKSIGNLANSHLQFVVP